MVDVAKHYDLLIENNNDPVKDSEELKRYMDKYDGEILIKELNLNNNASCLEIGCGTGRVLQKILNRYKSYTGIDLSSKTISRAKEHFVADNLVFICADFLEYKFSQKFDIIYSTLTFMHINNKEKALSKIYFLLNDGGKFVLSIDKNQNEILDTGFSRIKIFPDDKGQIEILIKKVGFNLEKCFETENAFIFSMIK